MGLGAASAIASASEGMVIAAFRDATYVRFATGVAAVAAPHVPPGPIHIVAPDEWTGVRAALAVGDRFVVPADWRDDAVVIWRGELPQPAALAARLPSLLSALAVVAAGSALLGEPLAGRWRAATEAPDLSEACRRLGGLGPGLTPSGDDALAGMFLAARIAGGRPAEDRLVALAGGVATHEIARAFLIWAARGQGIEPVHRLLAGESGAAAGLRAFGHTSGADLALGLLHGLVRFPPEGGRLPAGRGRAVAGEPL